jgi:hypothetical protein
MHKKKDFDAGKKCRKLGNGNNASIIGYLRSSTPAPQKLQYGEGLSIFRSQTFQWMVSRDFKEKYKKIESFIIDTFKRKLKLFT